MTRKNELLMVSLMNSPVYWMFWQSLFNLGFKLLEANCKRLIMVYQRENRLRLIGDH